MNEHLEKPSPDHWVHKVNKEKFMKNFVWIIEGLWKNNKYSPCYGESCLSELQANMIAKQYKDRFGIEFRVKKYEAVDE
jgi:hypothetical protein